MSKLTICDLCQKPMGEDKNSIRVYGKKYGLDKKDNKLWGKSFDLCDSCIDSLIGKLLGKGGEDTRC